MQRDLHGVLPDGIPEDWSYRRLQDVAAHITKGATPTTYGFAWESVGNKGTVPFMRSECVQDGEFVPLMMEAISPKAHTMMARSAVLGGDLLMTITGNIGRVCRYPVSAPESNINQHIARIRLVRPDLVDPDYAFWALHNPRQQSRLMKDLTGLAYPQISLAQVQEIPLPSPPLPEQRRIAEILDTLDEAIRKTEQVIAKLQQMKQGLLHDLLTRGIDENGELRDPERHPEQFKDSPLGRIPRGWQVQELGASVDILHGYAYDGAFFAECPPGPMLLTPGNFHRDGGLYFTSTNTKWFRGKLPRGYLLRGGDIVTVMTDLSPRTLILGSTVILDEGQELLHNQRIGKVVRKRSIDWESTFLALQMSSERFRRKVIVEATGTTVRHTSPAKMKANLVAKPPLSEQAFIVGSVVSYGAQIHSEVSGLAKLRSLKQGLMDDLLTGRVRVSVSEEATQ